MFYIRARKLWTKRPHTSLSHANWRSRSVDVFVHHTADSGPTGGARATVAQEIAYLRRIEDFHVETRGYRAIGYNYMVMPSGRVYEGRGFEIVGAHTLDPKDADGDAVYVENRDPGVVFAGNFEIQKPTTRALLAFKALKARLRLKGVRLDKQYSHSMAFATSCCGKNLRAKLGMTKGPVKA